MIASLARNLDLAHPLLQLFTRFLAKSLDIPNSSSKDVYAINSYFCAVFVVYFFHSSRDSFKSASNLITKPRALLQATDKDVLKLHNNCAYVVAFYLLQYDFLQRRRGLL